MKRNLPTDAGRKGIYPFQSLRLCENIPCMVFSICWRRADPLNYHPIHFAFTVSSASSLWPISRPTSVRYCSVRTHFRTLLAESVAPFPFFRTDAERRKRKKETRREREGQSARGRPPQRRISNSASRGEGEESNLFDWIVTFLVIMFRMWVLCKAYSETRAPNPLCGACIRFDNGPAKI